MFGRITFKKNLQSLLAQHNEQLAKVIAKVTAEGLAVGSTRGARFAYTVSEKIKEQGLSIVDEMVKLYEPNIKKWPRSFYKNDFFYEIIKSFILNSKQLGRTKDFDTGRNALIDSECDSIQILLINYTDREIDIVNNRVDVENRDKIIQYWTLIVSILTLIFAVYEFCNKD